MFHIQQINKNMLFYRINRNVFLGKKNYVKNCNICSIVHAFTSKACKN